MPTAVRPGRFFPDFSEEDWRQLVARSTGGSAPADLASRTDDGIPVGPLYGERVSGAVLAARTGPWTIVQRIDNPDVAAAVAGMRDDIAGGVGAFDLVFATSPSARGAGLPVLSDDHLDRLLAAAGESRDRLRIDAGEATPDLARRIIGRRGAGDLTLAFDPIATLAAQGHLTRPFDGLVNDACQIVRETATAFVADGRPWHAGGASEVQELATVTAAYAAYLGHLMARGIAPAEAAAKIGVALAADANQFLTIAKFRAIRQLVRHLLAGAGIEAPAVRLHAETAWRMMSRRDPHMNILRTTTAAFAAGIGGADSVTVLPFTAAGGVADAFARRLARNGQTILIEEANLARVADPAAGSGAVEALTDALAERAWDKFRAIERGGGLLGVVRAGSLQRDVAAMREERLKRIKAREFEMVGTTLYPEAGDLPPVQAGAAPTEETVAESVERLAAKRLSEPFEG